MCKILDYAEAKGYAKGYAKGVAKATKEPIMNMIEQNYTKEQILAIFNQVSEDLFNEYLNEYKKCHINN